MSVSLIVAYLEGKLVKCLLEIVNHCLVKNSERSIREKMAYIISVPLKCVRYALTVTTCNKIND